MKRLVALAALFALLAAVPYGVSAADRGGKGFSRSSGFSRGSSNRGSSSRGSSFNRGSSSRGTSFNRGTSSRGSSFSKSSSFGRRPSVSSQKPTIGKRPSLGSRPVIGKSPVTKPRFPTKPPVTKPRFPTKPPLTKPRFPTKPPVTKPKFPPTKPQLPPIGKPKFPPTKPQLPPIGKPKFPPTKPQLPPTKPQLPPWKPGKPPITQIPPQKPQLPPTIPPYKPGKPPWFPPNRPGRPWFPGPIVRPPVKCPGWNWGWGNCWQRPGFGFCYVRPNVYLNPYCQRPVIGGCDYSVPCVPNAVVTDAGQTAFEKAVAAFQAGDYAAANAFVEVALREMPGNADVRMLHSLILFAVGNHHDAAAVAHTAMTASAGWKWETLSEMYPDTDVYTAQLRSLEQASLAQPNAADLRFLLGVHYLMTGHEKTAGLALAKVNTLEPKDEVAKQLTTMLAPEKKGPAVPPAPAAEFAAPAEAAVDLTGTWTAQPASGVAITLMMNNDQFEWKLDLNGEKSQFDGTFTRTDDQLLLKRADGEELQVALENLTGSSFDLTPEGGQTLTFTR